MWILEAQGDLFQGKQMWLKPGQTYLFGRVKRDGVRYALDHKTISRKHFTLSVDAVKAGDSSRVHARTRITIKDLDSKHGTYMDGNLLKNGSRDFSLENHSIRPGTFPSELVIRWTPCNLTFQLNKKELKAGALKAKTERLESLDVKILTDYVNNTTTHVVASKRNTVKGLQALIQGKYLVGDSFVDALVYAATSAELGEDENLSPLEQDFEQAWPKEMDNLAPPGKEPTKRPDSTYKPDLLRNNIFDDYQFVFLDKSQYESLLPAITTGQGKSLHYELGNTTTTADDLVQFMRNAAGKRGFGEQGEDSLKGGAIMISCEGHKDHEEWTARLINEVALRLNQRAIDQAEFIDAILATDASLLKQSFPPAVATNGSKPPPTPPVEALLPPRRQLPPGVDSPKSRDTQPEMSRTEAAKRKQPVESLPQTTQTVRSSAPEPVWQSQAAPSEEPPRKKPRLRHVNPSRAKLTFDDDFDVNAIPLYSQEDFPEESLSRSASAVGSREQSIDNAFKEEPSSTQKRRRSSEQHANEVADSDDDHMDDMFPAAAAMRRQLAAQPAPKESAVPRPTASKKKQETEIDIRGVARKQRLAEEEAAKKEREAVAEDLAHDDHSGKPANLVKIEYMPVRTKKTLVPKETSGEADGRWDPKWNGRKNFKAFRRATAANSGEPRRCPPKVIVALVEVKTHSIAGDQSWDSGSRAKNRGGITQSKSQSQRQQATQSTSRTVGSGNGAIELSSDVDSNDEQPTSPQVAQLQAEAAAIVDHAVDVESPRRTRLGDKMQSANARSSQKRPASMSASGGGKEKRQKTIPTRRAGGDDSDSDGMKFKFGRRKK